MNAKGEKMKKYLIAIAVLSSACAQAGQWVLQVHVHSNHFADRAVEDWHEETDGFALRYAWNKTWSTQAGHYRNEYTVRHAGYNLFTNYALVDWTPVKWKAFSAGFYGGLEKGYNKLTLSNTGPVKVLDEEQTPMAAFGGIVGRVEYRGFNLTLRGQPDIPNAGPAAIKFEVGYLF